MARSSNRRADQRRRGRPVGERADVIDWETRAEELAAHLSAVGAVRDPAWRTAFATTPRHVFVPQFYALDQYRQYALWSAAPHRRSERPGWHRCTAMRCW